MTAHNPGDGVYLTRLIQTPFGQFMPGLLVTVLHDHGHHIDLCMDNGFPNPAVAHPCMGWTVKATDVAGRPPNLRRYRAPRENPWTTPRLNIRPPRNNLRREPA